MDRYCDPRSPWCTSGSLNATSRSQIACSSASRARSLRNELDTRQPTMRGENTSMTNATYTNPRHVARSFRPSLHQLGQRLFRILRRAGSNSFTLSVLVSSRLVLEQARRALIAAFGEHAGERARGDPRAEIGESRSRVRDRPPGRQQVRASPAPCRKACAAVPAPRTQQFRSAGQALYLPCSEGAALGGGGESHHTERTRLGAREELSEVGDGKLPFRDRPSVFGGGLSLRNRSIRIEGRKLGPRVAKKQ